MNIDAVLIAIQNSRAHLETWGITGEFLVAVALVTLVLFFLSLREVACWFLKVQALREEVKSLREQNDDIQLSLDLLRDSLTRMESKPFTGVETAPALEAPPQKRFTVDH